MELPNNSEYEHRSISSLKKSPSLHKRVSSKLSLKAIKIALEKIKIYGLCKNRANNIGIKRTGDDSRDGVDPPSYRLRHIWDWSQRWSGPSKGTTQLWNQRWRWRWS